VKPSLSFNPRPAIKVVALYSLLYTAFFAPVLLSNRLLAPGDGIIYFAANFASARVFWEPLIWGGFPAVADAQLMLWYPPAFLFSLFGTAGYQTFILFAYVTASSFTFGFVHSLTGSRIAAAFSGCVFGLSGFMLAHLGHATLIHSAAWFPLTIWSLHQLIQPSKQRNWFVIGALSVALNALAGHAQIFAYTMGLAGVFAIFNCLSIVTARLRYLSIVTSMFVLGTGLAAIQIWPTMELAALSWRASLNFSEFVAYELPLRQIPMLLFPYLYGGSPGSFYGLAYFGAWPSSADGWGAGELSGYAGLLTLLFAAIGIGSRWRRPDTRFWIVVAVIALLLTLGESTPLALLVYQLPVLNKFRVPARHFLELTFSLSLLAGFGVAALQQRAFGERGVRVVIAGGVSILLLSLILLFLFTGKINELAIQRLGHVIALQPWRNPAVAVPLVVFVIGAVTLWFWSRAPEATARRVLLVAVLLLDLASFGWFYEWHYRSPYKAFLRTPDAAEKYRAEVTDSKQRILPIRGGLGRVNELPPNLSRLWQVPSASGYGPFILSRVSRLLTMPPHGTVDESWRDPANQALNLMAVRYVILPPELIGPTHSVDQHGTRWADSDLAVDIGTGCNPANPGKYELNLSQPVRASSIAIVGALACSVQINGGTEVMRLNVADQDGKTESYPLQAGRDFSEWAFDCSDVTPTMQHARAVVFRSYKAQRGAIACEGHDYVARIQLNTPASIRQLSLTWTGAAGTFALKKITAIDENESTPLTSGLGSLSDIKRWKQVGQIDSQNSGYGNEVAATDQGTGIVFENLRVLPRSWFVQEVVQLPEDAVFNAVRSSRLPDGRVFEASKIALVERSLPASFTGDSNASASVVKLDSGVMEVKTASSGAAFLVTSDVLYPGWQASIDGNQVEIYQTNYAFRGVVVPAGNHVVRFEFKPRSFYYGAQVSLLAVVLMIGVVLGMARASNKKLPPSETS